MTSHIKPMAAGTTSAKKPAAKSPLPKKQAFKKAPLNANLQKASGFRKMLRVAPLTERVRIERLGVPSVVVKNLIESTGLTSSDFQVYFRIPKATFTKKMKEKANISGDPGHSALFIMDLINQVDDMLAAEPDNDATRNFDSERWVGEWIQRPQRALGGLAPAELLDTPTGRASVMRVLGAIQSGAYL